MEAGLLTTLAQVAGIAGISLGVLLILLRDIIRKNIFPKFKNEALAYRLLRLIVITVWTVAIFGIATWAVTAIFTGQGPETIAISHTEFSGDMQFADYDIIVTQYQEIEGEPLADELKAEIGKAVNLIKGGNYQDPIPLFQQFAEKVDVPAIHNNLGGLYALTSNYVGARNEYAKAIGQDPEYQPVQLNLGLLEESEGRFSEAERHLQLAEGYQTARELASKIKVRREAGTIEVEPNNTLLEPNLAPLGEWIQGSITEGDSDHFQIKTPARARDIVLVELENEKTTLRPRIGMYYENKQWLGGTTDITGAVTPGQNMQYSFSAEPDTTYFTWVGSLGSVGPYRLRITPQEKYDEFEPNEDTSEAKPISLGREIKANIMDGSDGDYFSIRSSGKDSTIMLSLKNQSNGLRPRIGMYYENKQWLGGTTDITGAVTPGQNMQYSFNTKANFLYYIWVGSLGGTGDYFLTVQEE